MEHHDRYQVCPRHGTRYGNMQNVMGMQCKAARDMCWRPLIGHERSGCKGDSRNCPSRVKTEEQRSPVNLLGWGNGSGLPSHRFAGRLHRDRSSAVLVEKYDGRLTCFCCSYPYKSSTTPSGQTSVAGKQRNTMKAKTPLPIVNEGSCRLVGLCSR